MKNRIYCNAALTLAALALFALNLNAQTRADVVKVYNEGAKSVQTNIDSAIIKFENVISLSQSVGETANDLKQKAEQALPGMYLKAVSNKLSAKKPGPEIVQAAKKASAVASKYGNETSKDNAGKLLLQAYNRMATEYFSKNEYDKAIATFDSVLAINPDYLPAIFNKAQVYKSQNNAAAFGETIDLYLTKTANDPEKSKQASSQALEYFRAAGSKANQEDKLDEALTLLNQAAKYGDDKDLFYYYADVYNKQKNFVKGAEFAKKGLDMETGGPDIKAKFYYQLAVAQAGQGQNAEACASFKNAMYGQFAEAAKAQSKNLKCQ